jgi:hypothetical protein
MHRLPMTPYTVVTDHHRTALWACGAFLIGLALGALAVAQ